jgi:acetyl-CoA synthetase
LANASPNYETADTAADDPAQLYYSSGTTGKAKGILHAHRYLLAHEEFEFCHDVRDGELFHGSGEWAWAAGICPLLGPWRYGAVQFVYARKGGFDPEEQLRQLSKHGVQNMFTTPTALRAMRAVSDAGSRYPLDRMRIVCSAGEPLNPEVIDVFRSALGLEIADGYGQTETGHVTGNLDGEPVREGSMGRPLPGIEVRIADGELQIRARSCPTFFSRYLDAEPFAGEWWPTGDMVRDDDDGYLWYEGRGDDLILSAGYRIGPFEVESALVSHPAVAEAAAVPAPDAERGAVVRAVVVLRDREPSDELARELQEHVKRVTAPYKFPRIVEFARELPKTATGKIKRAELR